jgi:hypothetical protein
VSISIFYTFANVNITPAKMRSFFEAIQSLFENFFFVPYESLRNLELSSWWSANLVNWIFLIICSVATVYWVKQLKLHNESGEDKQDTTAHSFLE